MHQPILSGLHQGFSATSNGYNFQPSLIYENILQLGLKILTSAEGVSTDDLLCVMYGDECINITDMFECLLFFAMFNFDKI
jgi:hypothetical protein